MKFKFWTYSSYRHKICQVNNKKSKVAKTAFIDSILSFLIFLPYKSSRTDSGIAALGPLTAALYTQVPSGYPEHLDNRILLRTIEENRDYCEKIGADPDEILSKIKNSTS